MAQTVSTPLIHLGMQTLKITNVAKKHTYKMTRKVTAIVLAVSIDGWLVAKFFWCSRVKSSSFLGSHSIFHGSKALVCSVKLTSDLVWRSFGTNLS